MVDRIVGFSNDQTVKDKTAHARTKSAIYHVRRWHTLVIKPETDTKKEMRNMPNRVAPLTLGGRYVQVYKRDQRRFGKVFLNPCQFAHPAPLASCSRFNRKQSPSPLQNENLLGCRYPLALCISLRLPYRSSQRDYSLKNGDHSSF
jgi:hypothetical protein